MPIASIFNCDYEELSVVTWKIKFSESKVDLKFPR